MSSDAAAALVDGLRGALGETISAAAVLEKLATLKPPDPPTPIDAGA
jgi:hypothetical protein